MINIQVLPKELQAKFNYDTVDDFYEGLASAEKNGKWFHINENGKPVYRKKYQRVEYFQNGLAWVMTKNNKWIRINKEGKEVQQKSTSSIT